MTPRRIRGGRDRREMKTAKEIYGIVHHAGEILGDSAVEADIKQITAKLAALQRVCDMGTQSLSHDDGTAALIACKTIAIQAASELTDLECVIRLVHQDIDEALLESVESEKCRTPTEHELRDIFRTDENSGRGQG